jgi:cAMP-dependent protein kinase regulator
MFSALDDKEKEIVVNAMRERKTSKGECVIKEGDQGDELYVVESGTLTCTKLFAGNSEPTVLKTYKEGEAFGELALLYNAPRAATITSDGDCVLWGLDRQTFNHIVKDSASKKRDKYDTFLSKVPILSTMEPYERSKLADALQDHKVKAGDYVIKEGDQGNEFYLLMEGEAIATKVLNAGEEAKQVMEYKVGDFFGERALLKNEPRAANVLAKTDCSLVSMDRHSFKRLLGPLDHLLKRNFEVYEQYALK